MASSMLSTSTPLRTGPGVKLSVPLSAAARLHCGTPSLTPTRRSDLRARATGTEERSRTTRDIDVEAKDNPAAFNGAPRSASNGAEIEKTAQQISGAVRDLPPEQAKALGELYLFLVQHPDAKLELTSIQSFSALARIFDEYQVLLWRPAEILNGRMAMIGIVAGLAAQLRTGASVWQQQYYAPYAYLAAYILVVIGAVLNKQFGSPTKGIGPFTRKAELWNGRAAMFGYASLALVSYQSDIARSALLWAQQLQRFQGVIPPGGPTST